MTDARPAEGETPTRAPSRGLRVVAALGGNALTRCGEAVSSEALAIAARTLAPLASGQLVVTHGNGPQVGLLARETLHTGDRAPALDVLDAESEGWLGYLIEQALEEALPGRELATVLTRVEVDADDPAFANPTKPIGPTYTAAEAGALRAQRGWQFADTSKGLRRVVPSPRPVHIRELTAIRLLIGQGVVTVCAGGGGIPVTKDASGILRGVEAVIDKDACSALLAEALEADALLLLTDVEGIYADWPTCERLFADVSARELDKLQLEAGSMGPKAAAACQFVRRTGGMAAIGTLASASRLLTGDAGTRIHR